MTDRELLASWELDILCAKNIGSVTLSKEFMLAIDDFINRQKAEIERLKAALNCYEETSGNKKAKAEAVKEFAERLSEKAPSITEERFPILRYEIDHLVKEFTEGG